MRIRTMPVISLFCAGVRGGLSIFTRSGFGRVVFALVVCCLGFVVVDLGLEVVPVLLDRAAALVRVVVFLLVGRVAIISP